MKNSPPSGPIGLEFSRGLVESGLALLAKASELNSILREVVRLSLEFCGADAASLFVLRDHELEFEVARNLTLESRGDPLPLARIRLPLDNSTICGFVARSGQTLFIDDVRQLPKGAPYRFNRDFDRRLNYRSQSMLVLPLTNSTGSVVGVLQMINHRVGGGFGPFPATLLDPSSILARQAGAALSHALLSEELRLSQTETVCRLGMAAEARDRETGQHIERVRRIVRILALASGQSQSQAELIAEASPLHDVGKIAIPDAILQKPGPLTLEERLTMQQHTWRGHELLADSRSSLLRLGASIALTHHERWDGSGYPRHLAGEGIPIEGRLVALADVFDALGSRRCYKEAWTRDEVFAHLRGQSGRHFDPAVVDAFFAGWAEIERAVRDPET